METLSSEILQKIFIKCDVGDRLLGLNLVDNRIRNCVPYYDIETLDIPYFENLSQRPLSKEKIREIKKRSGEISAFMRQLAIRDDERDDDWYVQRHQLLTFDGIPSNLKSDDDKARQEKEIFLLSVLKSVVPKMNHLKSVRFGDFKDTSADECPIEPKILSVLHATAPHLIGIFFGNRPVRFEALKLLPSFEKLSRLSIGDVGNNFDATLRRLRLTHLRIGGHNAPIMTENRERRSLMRHLTLQATQRGDFPSKISFPRRVSSRTADLPKIYPYLETLKISNVDLANLFNDWPVPPQVGYMPPSYYQDFDHRIGYLNHFQNLRRSNLCGSVLTNVASMVARHATIVPHMKTVRVQLPACQSGADMPFADEAVQAIQAWPIFLDKFQSMTTLIIGNRPWRFKFTIGDLFHVLQLENLRHLTLDELDMAPMESRSLFNDRQKFITDFLNGTVDNASFPIKCHGLKSLEIVLPLSDPRLLKTNNFNYELSRGPRNIKQSINIFDVFTRFVLAKCNNIQDLRLDGMSAGGWKSLINFTQRQGDSCPMRILRISSRGPCHPISIAELATGKWPRLVELNVLRKYTDYSLQFFDRLNVLRKYTDYVMQFIDRNESAAARKTSTGNGTFTYKQMVETLKAFPNLSVFGWPSTNSATDYFNAIFKGIPTLKKAYLRMSESTAITLKYVIGNHQSLEKLVLIDGDYGFWKQAQFENGAEFDRIVDLHRAMVRRVGWRREKSLEISKIVTTSSDANDERGRPRFDSHLR